MLVHENGRVEIHTTAGVEKGKVAVITAVVGLTAIWHGFELYE